MKKNGAPTPMVAPLTPTHSFLLNVLKQYQSETIVKGKLFYRLGLFVYLNKPYKIMSPLPVNSAGINRPLPLIITAKPIKAAIIR